MHFWTLSEQTSSLLMWRHTSASWSATNQSDRAPLSNDDDSGDDDNNEDVDDYYYDDDYDDRAQHLIYHWPLSYKFYLSCLV